MTSSDVNLLLEHYKVQVAELSRICGELTQMQHVNNKIIGVLERHIRDDVSNNNTESRSLVCELRELLHIGDSATSNAELTVGTDTSTPSDGPVMDTVVERENWKRAHEVRELLAEANRSEPQSQQEVAPGKKLAEKDESTSLPRIVEPSDFSASPSKTANSRHENVSPQKRPDSVSPSLGSAAYSVSPARRNVNSVSPRQANDEVASSFDEDAEQTSPQRAASASGAENAELDDSNEHQVYSEERKAGVITSAELNKLVDELSNASPKKPVSKSASDKAKTDKRPDVALAQAYRAADYEADGDYESDAGATERPHTAPALRDAEALHGSSVIESLRRKYPDAVVRQSSTRQRAAWLQDPLVQRAFGRLPWLVRGHLTRQLLQTDKVQQLKRIILDSAEIFADLYREIRERTRVQTAAGRAQQAPPTLTAEQKFLRDRILKQLRAALIDVNYTFHELTAREQVRLVAQHRVALLERERRARAGFDGESSLEEEVASPRERREPRLSAATLKKLEREARERSNSHAAHLDEPLNGVNGVLRREARLVRTRSAGAMENRPRTAPARDLPPRSRVNGANGELKPRTVLRNVQPAAERERPGAYKPSLGNKVATHSVGVGTYTKTHSSAAQRIRDRSKSHNVVFDEGRL